MPQLHSLKILVALFFVLLPVITFSADLKLGWYPSPESNIVGYKVFYGTQSHNYTFTLDINNPQLTNGLVTATLPNLVPQTTYYFAVVSYNDHGLTSPFSPELSWTCTFDYNKNIFINPIYDGNPANCLPSIGQGYAIASTKDTLYISADEFHENLEFNLIKQITFSTGWVTDFRLHSQQATTIHGYVTITAGTMLLEGPIIISP